MFLRKKVRKKKVDKKVNKKIALRLNKFALTMR